MERDTALLSQVAEGERRALRLYRWATPTLSLGRFQSDDEVDHDACRRIGVAVVRRPTGGKALLHGADLTYAVAIPRPGGADGSVDAVYCRLAGALVAGLARLGVDAAIARHEATDPNGPRVAHGPVCFTSMQGADLRVGDRKLCGSAQVRRGGAVLQHGSILLDRLPFDESALLVPRRGATVVGSDDLRRMTVTMRELGAPHDARSVASAIVDGFRETLDVDFT
jgi:lipoate-protein ligase A